LTGHENLNELPPLLFLKASRGQKAKTTFRTDFVFPPFALFLLLLGLQFIKFKKKLVESRPVGKSDSLPCG
jgi:hypothetical protein